MAAFSNQFEQMVDQKILEFQQIEHDACEPKTESQQPTSPRCSLSQQILDLKKEMSQMQQKYEGFCRQTMDMMRKNYRVAVVGSELCEKLETVGRNGQPIGFNYKHPKVATKTINLICKTSSDNTAMSVASTNDFEEKAQGKESGKVAVE